MRYKVNVVITTSIQCPSYVYEQATQLAHMWNAPFVARGKKTVRELLFEFEQVLIVYADRWEFRSKGQEPFFFHVGTVAVKIHQPSPLLQLVGKGPFTVLDCTMGLAHDSILLSYEGHSVVALESHPIIHCITSRGLRVYKSGNESLDAAMRRIKTKCVDSLDYLKAAEDNSVDIVYVDPMFLHSIEESTALKPIESLANYQPITQEWIEEAKRVAKRCILLKAHFRDDVFERFGFERHVRKTAKFHYGILKTVDEN